jgi:hypothetical protein
MLLMSFLSKVSKCALSKTQCQDGACVFTGKAAIYYGKDAYFDDKKDTLLKNQPAVCDKTAQALADLNRDDIYISESTFHYNGGGCC